jgi:aminoglycoside 3-N-acetyltransferase
MGPERVAIGRARLTAELRWLGLRDGAIAIVHTRMSALGRVIGGSETVVRALLDALGPDGTLMTYASWEEHVYVAEDWPAEHRAAYAAEPPAFDPETAEAARENGRIPERARTWPAARRTAHPEASVVAVGARAAWLCAEQPDDDAYGARSPFARLVQDGGQVLMLGAPLDTITLLHHAEAIARVPAKRFVTSRIPVVEAGRVVQRSYTDILTGPPGAVDYARLGLDEDEFAVIARDALAAGIGVRGLVGQAECHLFDAAELTRFAVAWLEERFGVDRPGRA